MEENNKTNPGFPIDDNGHEKLDHYHNDIHFDGTGNKDLVLKTESLAKSFLIFNKRNLILKITLTGVFLALACAVSAIDMLLESAQIPVDSSGNVFIGLRFLDLAVIILSIAVVGPTFTMIVCILEPWLHNLIHGLEHGWLQPILDGFTNIFVVIIVTIFFYIIFKNSPIHRNGSSKQNWCKRLIPGLFIIPISALVATIFVLIGSLIMSKISTSLTGEPAEGIIDFDEDKGLHISGIMVTLIFLVECMHFAFVYALFIPIEWRLRPINHRFNK